MNVVGIFVVDNVIMTLAFIGGSMFLLLPTLFVNSDEVAMAMKQISDNTLSNCNALEQVTTSTQNSSAATQSLVEIVEQIKGLSAQLNSVVQR